MKKYHLFLIVAFAFLIFISGCNTQKQIEIPSELIYPITGLPLEIKNCENALHDPEAIPFSKRDLCYYELALEHKNPTVCSLIESETFDDDCYKVLAERMQDYRICGHIDPSGNMGLCYFDFLEEMPVGIEFCEYLTYPGHWDSCIAKMAAFIPNLDYEICDDVTQILGVQATCYENIAIQKNELMGCDRINNKATRDSCYKRFAIRLGDETICDLFYYPDNIPYCYIDMAVDKSDLKICDNINLFAEYDNPEEELRSFRDYCYKQISLDLNDETICEDIYSEEDKGYCVQQVRDDILREEREMALREEAGL